jgi:ribonuclease HI
MKINVDASVARSGDRGADAAVCREEHGMHLGASAVVYSGMTLKALACNEGLSLALYLNVTKVQIVSDCLEVVSNLKNDAPYRYATIIKEILDRGRILFQDAVFNHEQRVLNIDAHNLARAATSIQEGRHIWLLGVPDITCIPMNILNEYSPCVQPQKK